MQDIITTVLFIVIPAIALLIAFLLGLKRNIYQSVAKLAMTILSIVICAILVKAVTPSLVSSVIGALGMADEDILRYFLASSISDDVLKFISSIILPLVFFAVYLVVAFIFALLYLIPGRLLSNKAIERRNASKAARQNAADINADGTVVQPVEEVQQSENPVEQKKINWPKIGLRAGSVACCLLSAILVLSAFALPINAYSRLMTTVTEGFGEVSELDSDAAEIIAVIENVDSHPTNRCYGVFNAALRNYFDRFTTNNGIKVATSESISSMISLAKTVMEFDTAAMNSEFFYKLADRIGENGFIQNTVTQMVHDLCDAWLNEEAFFGFSAPELDGQVMNMLLTKLSDCDDVTGALRAVGDALTLQQALTNNNGIGNTATMIGLIFENIDAGSADMIKAFVSEEVLTDIVSMPPTMAQSVSGFVGNVVEGIVEIKDDPNLSDKEKTVILNQEAAAMAAIVDMIKNPEAIEAENLIGSVVESTVISGTIQKVTDNGAIRNPYEIADALAPEFTESVANELKNQGVEESSELYSSIMALFGQ